MRSHSNRALRLRVWTHYHLSSGQAFKHELDPSEVWWAIGSWQKVRIAIFQNLASAASPRATGARSLNFGLYLVEQLPTNACKRSLE